LGATDSSQPAKSKASHPISIWTTEHEPSTASPRTKTLCDESLTNTVASTEFHPSPHPCHYLPPSMQALAPVADALGTGLLNTSFCKSANKVDIHRFRHHCSTLISVLRTAMRYVTMTEFKQQANRILNNKKPTAILRNSKIEGYYVPAKSLVFDTMDDARVQELTRSILDQRSEALAYLAKQ